MAHLHTHADDITLTAGSEKEPKMKVKEGSEKAGAKLKKLRSWHPAPSLHGKQMGKQCKK